MSWARPSLHTVAHDLDRLMRVARYAHLTAVEDQAASPYRRGKAEGTLAGLAMAADLIHTPRRIA